MADNTLPQPPLKYDQAYERMRNRRLEELLRGKQDTDSIQSQVYNGTPHAALIGTNPAFADPGAGVITLLPFNTVFVNNPDMIVGNNVQLAYTMNMIFYLSLFHVSGAGGNVSLTLYLFLNGVEINSGTRSAALGDNELYALTVFGKNIPPGQVLDLRISHTTNPDLIIDMTKSRWWMTQLTPNPSYVADQRWVP